MSGGRWGLTYQGVVTARGALERAPVPTNVPPRSVPQWLELHSTRLPDGLMPDCNCYPAAIHQGVPVWMLVHTTDCFFSRAPLPNFEPTEAEKKRLKTTLVLPGGGTWKSSKPARRRRIDVQAKSPYRLMLQFFFQRPVSIELWKRIKAPRGWKKCPTTQEKQRMYQGVRFMCRDLKYALTPDEVQELLARLYLSLEDVW